MNRSNKDLPTLYRSKWACFHCRTAFVRYVPKDSAHRVCLTCKRVATDMGYLFEPPRRNDYKSWRIVELLAQYQLSYDRNGMIPKIRYLITEDSRASYTEIQRNLEILRCHKKSNHTKKRDT